MAIIEEIYPDSALILIRNRVGEIIVDEFAKQYADHQDELYNNTKVWLERYIPFQLSELPSLTVYFNTATYESKTPRSSKGSNIIMIEAITGSEDSAEDYGDTLAAIKCQKLLSSVRYILMHPAYLRLNFNDPRFITTTKVNTIRMAQPDNSKDGMKVVVGQLVFEVGAVEDNGILSGLTLDEYENVIKIDESEKGILLTKQID